MKDKLIELMNRLESKSSEYGYYNWETTNLQVLKLQKKINDEIKEIENEIINLFESKETN